MANAGRLITVEEFANLPEPSDGKSMQLVQGRVVTMPPTSGGHGERATDIGAMLRTFVRKHQLGRVGTEIGFVLARDPGTVFAPDVAFLAADRVAEVDWDEGYIEGPPNARD